MKYELHPLCSLFPRLTGAEFDALRDDIAANGLREPIVLHDGMILDGGNRYHACLAAGVEPKFVRFSGESLVAFVLSANLHRRHMTAGQQAAIVASAQDWAKAQGRGRPAGNPEPLPDSKPATVADRAAQSGASEKTQRMADKVARKDPELAKKVAHGEVSLPKAVEAVEGKKRVSESDKLRAKVEELEEEIERLQNDLVNAQDAAEQAVETAKNLQALADGEEAKRLAVLTSKLRAAEASRDAAMNENAALKAEVKRLRRQVERAAA